jgi:2-polyprenyl-6-methoxyphenol hydroxylase-like FAD-dependent oxidoreductase
MFFRNTELQILAERDDAKILGATASDVERRAIGRAEFRDILLDGLDDVVHWGNSFVDFSRKSDGRAVVSFTDGMFKEGDVLIGADGAQSRVRKQYLPQIQRLDLGIHAIAGRCTLNDELRRTLPREIINGSLNNIVPTGKGWMFVSCWDLTSNDRTHNSTKVPPDIVWAYIVPSEDDTAAISILQPSALQGFVLGGMKRWSTQLRSLVLQTDPSTISCISLKSMPFLERWEPTNVTVLGDAIHNMTPMAGVGANTALRDAELLTDLLSHAALGTMEVETAIGFYEERMRAYANEAVSVSKRNAVSASFGRGIQRWGFRMLLKAAQASPLVMRETLGRSVTAVS